MKRINQLEKKQFENWYVNNENKKILRFMKKKGISAPEFSSRARQLENSIAYILDYRRQYNTKRKLSNETLQWIEDFHREHPSISECDSKRDIIFYRIKDSITNSKSFVDAKHKAARELYNTINPIKPKINIPYGVDVYYDTIAGEKLLYIIFPDEKKRELTGWLKHNNIGFKSRSNKYITKCWNGCFCEASIAHKIFNLVNIEINEQEK